MARTLSTLFAALLSSGCYTSHLGVGTTDDDSGFPADGGFDGPRPRDGGPPDSSIFPRDSDVPPDARPRDSSPRDSRVDAPPRDSAADTRPVDSGRPSRALSFGRGDRVFVARSVTLDITSSHTYELWIRPRTDGLVLHKGEIAEGERYQYLVEVREGFVISGCATEEGEALVRAPIRMGVWNHVSVVIDVNPMSAELVLYVDGMESARAFFPNTLFAAINDRPFLMGGFTGDIDEVRLFTFARTALEVRRTMLTRLTPPPPGMEAYWPLEESGQLALDRSLRGNDGVLGDFTFPDGADPTWINDGPIP
jgi:hypothetical protein